MEVLPGFFGDDQVERLRYIMEEMNEGGWDVLNSTRYYRIIPSALKPRDLANVAARPLMNKYRSLLGPLYMGTFFLNYPLGGFTHAHVDQHCSLRINILLEEPTSGELRINGAVVPMRTGDAIMFNPSEDEHEVTHVVGNRIIWSLGFTKELPPEPRRRK